MENWMTAILVFHVVVALTVIGLVLLQHGKGADMGSGFGGGSSGSLFGATGSANFLSRATAVLATVFFLTSLGLAYLATHRTSASGGVMDAVKTQKVAPATVPGADNAPAKSVDAPVEKPSADKSKDVPN